MIRMEPALAQKKLGAQMLLQVHDELVFEVAGERGRKDPAGGQEGDGGRAAPGGLALGAARGRRARGGQLGRGALRVVALPTLLAFIVTCTVVEITPGPNMAYLAALSLSRGWRAGLAAVAGVAIGLAVYGVAAALGVATVIENSRFLYEALRWGGVAYLLWLAWDAWSTADVTPEDVPDEQALVSAFRRGLVTNLLNPKAPCSTSRCCRNSSRSMPDGSPSRRSRCRRSMSRSPR